VELNTPGFFILRREKMENKKENKFFLNPEERVALIDSKVERAREQVELMIAQIETVKKVKRNEQIDS